MTYNVSSGMLKPTILTYPQLEPRRNQNYVMLWVDKFVTEKL